jgi:hypothetical protein
MQQVRVPRAAEAVAHRGQALAGRVKPAEGARATLPHKSFTTTGCGREDGSVRRPGYSMRGERCWV